MNIAGKKILVTGGAKGLGLEMVQRIANLGAHPIVLDKDEQALDALPGRTQNTTGIKCDLASSASVEKSVDKAWQKQGEIHGLINNAGLLYSAPLIGIGPSGLNIHDTSAWEKVININLNAVFYVTANLVANMVKARTKGVIINISSVCATGNAGQGAYSAAKAGVEALTVTWAKELGPWGIRVVGLAPGFIETPSTHNAIAKNILEQIRKELPIGRLGESSEVAHAVQFLIENDYVNGVTLKLDGGLRI